MRRVGSRNGAPRPEKEATAPGQGRVGYTDAAASPAFKHTPVQATITSLL